MRVLVGRASGVFFLRNGKVAVLWEDPLDARIHAHIHSPNLPSQLWELARSEAQQAAVGNQSSTSQPDGQPDSQTAGNVMSSACQDASHTFVHPHCMLMAFVTRLLGAIQLDDSTKQITRKGALAEAAGVGG